MKIDVVIPLFNGEKYIREALNSVLAQTVLVNQIIIVDDGSTDRGLQIVNEVSSSQSRVEFKIYMQNRQGPSAARNLGIQNSRGDWVAFLDADDLWYPQKLERQIEVVSASKWPNLGLVYCDYENVTAEGLSSDFYKLPFEQKAVGSCMKFLMTGNYILSSCSGALVMRECFSDVGIFDVSLRGGEDWDMWIRISEKYQIDWVPEVLVKIRRHDQNSTSNEIDLFKNDLIFFEKYFKKYPNDIRLAIFRRLVRAPNMDLFFQSFEKDFVKKSFKNPIEKYSIAAICFARLFYRRIKFLF